MSKKHVAWTFGRFNPPTEAGHGKLIKKVQEEAKKVKGDHFIFPSHSQDAKSNPLTHDDKVAAMQKMFPSANIVSDKKIRTFIDALKYLNAQGYDCAIMVAGSDRVPEYKTAVEKYNGKEYKYEELSVISAGKRDPDSDGAEGMSASKLRALVAADKQKEFISHYTNKKVGANLYDRIKNAQKK